MGRCKLGGLRIQGSVEGEERHLDPHDVGLKGNGRACQRRSAQLSYSYQGDECLKDMQDEIDCQGYGQPGLHQDLLQATSKVRKPARSTAVDQCFKIRCIEPH